MTPVDTTMPLIVLQTIGESLGQLFQWPQVLGLLPLALAVWVVYVRTQDSSDPSGSVALRSDTGSFSLTVSGAYWVGVLVAAVVLLTWPVPMEAPLFGLALVAVLGVAWWLEKQEASS